MVRTRIAPSPTGYPHIGTIYQALFDYAFAKKHSGQFIVRIEDTDRSRLVADAENVIFSSLDWFGLIENESPRKGGEYGPYRQSERLSIYHKYVEELLKNDHAYFSFFPKNQSGQKHDYSHGKLQTVQEKPQQNPPKTISEMIERGDWVVRMRVPKEESITVRDEIRGDITFPLKEVTEQVLLKSDGYPTYHLAVVVDDHLMKISHIVRAEEWIASLPKHVLLFKYFAWDMPLVYHTATLRNPDKSKLSKRHGHTSVVWYQEQGFLPEAILNYLALLGWSHPDEEELFSLDEFISVFDLKDIRPIAPIFDLQKLIWLNGRWIREKLTVEALKKRLLNFYTDDKEVKAFIESNPQTINAILGLAQTRMKTLLDFKTFIPQSNSTYTEEEEKIAKSLFDNLHEISNWKTDAIFQALKTVLEQYNIRMPVLYKIFTGKEKGLPLPDFLEILGKEQILNRLQQI